jgi:hypothetical protein
MLAPGALKRTPKPMLNKWRLRILKLGDEVRDFDVSKAVFTVSKTLTNLVRRRVV